LKRIESVWKPGSYQIQSLRASFVLVLEKESVLFDLVEQRFMQRHPECILITARGYSDLNTKHLIRELFRSNPRVPFLYLGDYDPFGLDIFLNYCYSSPIALWEDLGLPFIEHIGLNAAHLLHFNKNHLLDLSIEDHRKIETLLKEPFLQPHHSNSFMCTFQKAQVAKTAAIRDMLLAIQRLNLKAETEILSAANSLVAYIEYQLISRSILHPFIAAAGQ